MSARELTQALGGRWHGRYGTARCPAHKDRHPSLTVRDGDSAPLLNCKAGCPREDVISALKSLGLWGSRDSAKVVTWRAPAAKPKPSPTVYWHTRDAPRETQRACDIWREDCGSFGADTPPVDTCRPGHSAAVAGDAGLRAPRPPRDPRAQRPAMIVARQCPVVGLVRGIQRVFLDEAGRKYQRGAVKMSLGSIAGGRAELIWPDDELVLCEGVETALSAWWLFRTPAWAICGPFPAELLLP